MIYYVYASCKKAKGVEDVIVATDDSRIKECVEGFGGRVVMTSNMHQTGTDRIAEVAQGLDADIIVNAQGDEPLMDPQMIREAATPLISDPGLSVTTLMSRLTSAEDFVDTTIVKLVKDTRNNVMFMTRSPVPYPKTRINYSVYKQIGLYAFRREYLIRFTKMKQTPLELIEGIELLRVIESGHRLAAVETKHRTYSVDTLSDLIEVEKLIKRKAG
jgi:3-deoxy-manno-octulosonate cytidylyltransferase (CMP-KDO synthetase)